MDNVLISIIIPTYNIESYLARCLDSVLNQNYRNLEIILVDDGSIDNTGKIIDEYALKDSRIKVIYKKNTGVSDTRNKGLDIATGNYIGFVDGDDVIHQDMYRILMKNALKYDADISHCGYQMVFPNRKDDYYGTEKLIIQDNTKGIYDLLSAEYVEPGLCNKIYKKELMHELRLNKDVRINEDLLFNYYAFKKSKKSVFEDKMLYYYMVRSSSASTQKLNRNKILDPIKVLREIEKQEDGDNQKIVQKRLLYVLEKFCAYKKNVLTQFISEKEYVDCRSIMKELLIRITDNSFISSVEKGKAKLAFYCPIIYRFVYWLYDKITKSSKKYEV